MLDLFSHNWYLAPMIINRLANGDLSMKATPKEQAFILQMFESNIHVTSQNRLNGYAQEAAFLAQFLRPTYLQTAPCSVGALTDGPLITDGIDAWVFANYQIESFLELLAAHKEIIWKKG